MRDAELFLRVARFHADYARAIDEDRLEDWPAFFAEDGHYRVTTDDNHRQGHELGLIYAEGRGMLADRISSLRNANIFERHRYRHLVGLPHLVHGQDGPGVDGLRADTPFAVFRIMRDGATTVFATGRYLDRFAQAEGELLLAERIVVCDSSTIDTLLVIPL